MRTYLSKILFCELCKTRRATDTAHRLKRRFIGWRTELDKREYFMAARLCRSCHRSLDEASGPNPHERMFTVITRIAVARPRGKIHGKYIEPHPVRTWDSELIYRYER